MASPTYKDGKDKDTATPQLEDPGSAQILREVNASLSDQKVATDKKKANPAKLSSKKKSSKSSSSSVADVIKPLDEQWSERILQT